MIGPKQHFTSPEIKAYFQIDLERLRSYGLSREQVRALAAWAIYKIRRVLVASRDGVADLRTECKFEVKRREKKSEGEKNDTERPEMEEALDCWMVDQESGLRKRWELPIIDDDLKKALDGLKRRLDGSPDEFRPPISVRWVPNLEGKAEIPENVKDDRINRKGFEAKTKIESPKPKKGKKADAKQAKKFFIIFGEWSSSDKDTLRSQNTQEPAKDIVDKAIKDFEKNWEAKAQSRKPDKTDEGEQGDENQA